MEDRTLVQDLISALEQVGVTLSNAVQDMEVFDGDSPSSEDLVRLQRLFAMISRDASVAMVQLYANIRMADIASRLKR